MKRRKILAFVSSLHLLFVLACPGMAADGTLPRSPQSKNAASPPSRGGSSPGARDRDGQNGQDVRDGGVDERELDDREPELLYNTASRFYRQKNWRDAAGTFGEFLRKFPRHRDAAEARFAAGYSFNRLGDHAAAVEMLRLAAKEEGSLWSPDASFYLGNSLEALATDAKTDNDERVRRLLSAAQSYGRAAKLYEKLCAEGQLSAKSDAGKSKTEGGNDRSKPCDLRVLSMGSQGEALYRAERYAEGSQALEGLLKEAQKLGGSPHFQRGVYVLGLCREALARAGAGRAPRFAAAREALGIAALPRYEAEPMWEEAACLLGKLDHEDGELEKAIGEYGRVVKKRGPRAPEAAYRRGLVLYETQKPELVAQAREELSSFVKDYPDHALRPKAMFYEALSAFDLKDYAACESAFAAVAAESEELAGRALLRRGQALLLKQPSDPVGAAETLGKAAKALQDDVAQPRGDPAAAQKVAEALYWKGEAFLAQGGKALLDAAQAYGEVHTRFSRESPDLAETALYQKARALHLAQKHAQCAEACDLYRKAYPADRGKFHGESLLLSAESAFRAAPGEIPEALRRDAPRLYGEAAQALKEPAEARRARYMKGVSLYFLGAHKQAAETLEQVSLEEPQDPSAGADAFPELFFYLADSLAKEPRQGAATPEERERWKKASLYYRRYLDQSKDRAHIPNALVNLGLCLEWLEDHQGAKKTLETFLTTFPNHELSSQVRFELGNVKLVLGDMEGAARAYASAADGGVEVAGQSLLPARALFQKAMLERRMGKPAEAVETLSLLLKKHEAALKDDGSGESLARDAEYQRAIALLEGGKAEEARLELAGYVERNAGSPREAEARNQLARSLLDAGKPAEALDVVKPLIAQGAASGGRDQALYLAAWCHSALAAAPAAATKQPSGTTSGGDGAENSSEALKHREEMESFYRRLIAEHPQSTLAADAMLELGQHLFNRKAYPESKKWLEQAREAGQAQSSSGEREAATRSQELLEKSLFGLGFIAFEENEFLEAAKLLDGVSSRAESPLAPRATFQSGRALMKAGNAAGAALRFKKVADDFKSRPEVKSGGFYEESLLRLSECCHQLQKYDEAIRSADRLLAEFPQGTLRHEARFQRGFALQFSGDHEGAIAAYRSVVAESRAPVSARAQYHIGECRMEQKKYREATKEFNTAVANFDFDGEYREWIRRSLLSAGMAYQSAGDAAAAVAQFSELKERFPDTEEGKAAAERLRELGKSQ